MLAAGASEEASAAPAVVEGCCLYVRARCKRLLACGLPRGLPQFAQQQRRALHLAALLRSRRLGGYRRRRVGVRWGRRAGGGDCREQSRQHRPLLAGTLRLTDIIDAAAH